MEDARLASEFTELYRGHYGRVLRYIARRVGPGGEPEDLTAEVFRIAWDRVQNGDQLAPSWLFGTARNLLQNHWRAEVRATRLHREATGELRSAPLRSPPIWRCPRPRSGSGCTGLGGLSKRRSSKPPHQE